ncbi:lipoprotein insertase outer membrane protein LolB [Marinagarivorans cellulosilyticus]|uniref:Outer-membrane lipoprotein LolB n=1 Tax=Marinagarivorans cellulosilyticus TaxID=2721545 RepID=A0AAN1WEF0_9GAMM|nr:lipoprotein insertase outer membrane protein LolB [Marinagarivorans cellulosilyticus]BCD96084.1 outer membrane lipoprotein LolB [Marinagarivorans cellulosilyticus]
MRKLLHLSLLALLLSGCQSFTPSSTPITGNNLKAAKAHTAKLNQFNRWKALGKIKITVDDQPHSASFEWQQFKDNYAINFFGPFGYGSSWLRRTSKGVTLESPEHPIQWAPTPEQLLQQTVGWQAPINELQYWIKGQPAPAAIIDKVTTTPEGAYSALTQQGWDIQLSRHQQYGELSLPHKLIASRQGLSVLIIIKQWERK